MQEIDFLHPMDIEDKADDIDYAIDEIVEYNYLDQLFGDNSKLNYQEWKEQSIKKKAISLLWYEPENLR